MEWIDTHAHLTFDPLADDIEAVLDRSRAAGVTEWVTVGTDPAHNDKAIDLAERFEGVYATVGIHPHDAKIVTADVLAELLEAAKHPKVVAIGETGLDYHYNLSPQEQQRRAFAAQLKIATELNLPVVVHSREAFAETLEMLERHGGGVHKVVFHCFSGSPEQAREALGKGYYISFTGVVTFRNAENTRAAAAAVPIERLMLETDCPYMSPEPVRKQKVNEPGLMIHTAMRMAELKHMEPEAFAAVIRKTSRGFFNLPGL